MRATTRERRKPWPRRSRCSRTLTASCLSSRPRTPSPREFRWGREPFDDQRSFASIDPEDPEATVEDQEAGPTAGDEEDNEEDDEEDD
jgi:hypothetical protein